MGVFHAFFKLYKWYQIAQHATNLILIHKKVTLEEKLRLVKCFHDRIIEFIDDEEEMLHETEASGEFSRYVFPGMLTKHCLNFLNFFNQRNLF